MTMRADARNAAGYGPRQTAADNRRVHVLSGGSDRIEYGGRVLKLARHPGASLQRLSVSEAPSTEHTPQSEGAVFILQCNQLA